MSNEKKSGENPISQLEVPHQNLSSIHIMSVNCRGQYWKITPNLSSGKPENVYFRKWKGGILCISSMFRVYRIWWVQEYLKDFNTRKILIVGQWAATNLAPRFAKEHCFH